MAGAPRGRFVAFAPNTARLARPRLRAPFATGLLGPEVAPAIPQNLTHCEWLNCCAAGTAGVLGVLVLRGRPAEGFAGPPKSRSYGDRLFGIRAGRLRGCGQWLVAMLMGLAYKGYREGIPWQYNAQVRRHRHPMGHIILDAQAARLAGRTGRAPDLFLLSENRGKKAKHPIRPSGLTSIPNAAVGAVVDGSGTFGAERADREGSPAGGGRARRSGVRRAGAGPGHADRYRPPPRQRRLRIPEKPSPNTRTTTSEYQKNRLRIPKQPRKNQHPGS